MSDHLVRLITRDGTLRACAAETTLLAEECRHRQQTDPTATVALGRIVTAAALCGSLLKGAQRLALIVEGNGPLQKLQAETDAHGRVRATIKAPVAGLPPREGRFDVARLALRLRAKGAFYSETLTRKGLWTACRPTNDGGFCYHDLPHRSPPA